MSSQETPFQNWSTEAPSSQPQGLEATMLSDDKIFVVLAVVLIIWFGIVALLFRNDRKLARLERKIDAGIPEGTTA